MKRWKVEVAALGAAVLAGLALAAAMRSSDVAPTTWSASVAPEFTLIRMGTADVVHVTVANTGHALGGFAACWVWGWGAGGHLATGSFEETHVLRPGQSARFTVLVTADGYPPRIMTQVTGFNAACYDFY